MKGYAKDLSGNPIRCNMRLGTLMQKYPGMQTNRKFRLSKSVPLLFYYIMMIDKTISNAFVTQN